MAQTGDPQPMGPLLDEQGKQALQLQEHGDIDETFHVRHQRLVAMTRLVFTPQTDDAGRAAAARDLDAFARSVQGADAKPISPGGALAAIAPVLLDELLSLHMLLDGSTDREAARAQYMPAPP